MTVAERLWKTFNKALGQYQLIDENDKILIGLSGGKDSLCLLEFMARRSKVHVPHFTVEALHVRMENVHYETDTSYLQSFCDHLGVPLHIITTSINPPPSTLHKIALGHHQDDIIHTALMNLTFQGHFSTMPALLRMRKMPITIIRPLCLCTEDDIRAYAEEQGYQKQLKQCPYEHDTNRTDIQAVYQHLQQLNPEVRYSIWNALQAAGKLVEY